jgi:hypothetical protein
MEWAKTRSHARFNLATSGIASVPIREMPMRLEELEITGAAGYGYRILQQKLAAKYGVPAECVVEAQGTSMANHLAFAACFDPGDEILIEHPTYELLLSAAQFLGARIRRFSRRFEDGFRLDPVEIERNLTPDTRLIVLTNLHNPSGVLVEDAVLRDVGAIARRVGARVLVDEVYLDMAFERAPRTSFLLDPQSFVVTNSLTKAYGLSGLRCGWILAQPELAHRMWRINDLFGASHAHPAERLSVVALDHLDQFVARTKTILAANRPLLNKFLDSRKDLDVVRSEFGTICFPRLQRGNPDEFFALLRERYETTVVPGHFFEMPPHFRVGIGGDAKFLEAGLERLGAALDEFKA